MKSKFYLDRTGRPLEILKERPFKYATHYSDGVVICDYSQAQKVYANPLLVGQKHLENIPRVLKPLSEEEFKRMKLSSSKHDAYWLFDLIKSDPSQKWVSV